MTFKHEWKPGDRAKCVDVSFRKSMLTHGHIYEVEAVAEEAGSLKLWLKGQEVGLRHMAHRFKPVIRVPARVAPVEANLDWRL